jgi:hypothetical protein
MQLHQLCLLLVHRGKPSSVIYRQQLVVCVEAAISSSWISSCLPATVAQSAFARAFSIGSAHRLGYAPKSGRDFAMIVDPTSPASATPSWTSAVG